MLRFTKSIKRKKKYTTVFGTTYNGIYLNIDRANISDEEKGINKNDYVVLIRLTKDDYGQKGWYVGVDSMKEFAIIKAIGAMTRENDLYNWSESNILDGINK